MADPTEIDNVLTYGKPPVVETVLGVQFDRLPDFRNAHLGAFWKTLDSEEWSEVQDVSILSPQFEQFSKNARWAKGVQLQITQNPDCRLQIKNKTGDRMIQVQNNRFHFNWIGKPEGEYPRHKKVRDGFEQSLRQFIKFLDESNVGEFRPNQWEVTYVNHIPQGTVWNKPSEWNFFKPLNGIPSIENLVEAETFNGEWHFVIPGQKGRLHVRWHHGVRSDRPESGEELVLLNFTARGKIEKSDDSFQATVDGIELGRKTIVLSFKNLMSDKANTYWGLKHDND